MQNTNPDGFPEENHAPGAFKAPRAYFPAKPMARNWSCALGALFNTCTVTANGAAGGMSKRTIRLS
ncbi:MAG: hypothetical protein HY741_03930 [Chloroflexi bacterium]|nr:hypothetical protein [Chloroflexota bacterium]